MAKKFFASSIIVTIIVFFGFGFCFATEEDKNTMNSDLGSELNDSMNKVEKNAENLTDGMRDDNKKTEQWMPEAISGNNIRNDYEATRTSAETNFDNMTGMSGTTWIWVVLAVAAIVILLTVWFYAMQDNGND